MMLVCDFFSKQEKKERRGLPVVRALHQPYLLMLDQFVRLTAPAVDGQQLVTCRCTSEMFTWQLPSWLRDRTGA